MSINEYARTVGKPIGSMGGGFMMHPETGTFGDSVGLNFFEFYALGRGGVLGDVNGETVADAFYFFEPTLVKGVWEEAKKKMAPAEAVKHYVDACAAWGRARFADIEGLDDFCKQAERIAQSAEPTPSSVLFAGWRNVQLPEDGPARAAALITLVLRELRGGAHIDAVKQIGLAPIEALSVNSPAMAPIFGYTGELPDAEALREKAEKAEALTDEFVAPAFSVLDDGERDAFGSVLTKIATTAGV